MDLTPIISCICVTRNRVTLLSRAINCFIKQTYEYKQLVILFETEDASTGLYSLQGPFARHPQIKWLQIDKPADMFLGQLRNHAIEKASGEYVCQWDDDDWYHPEKLSFQFSELINNGTHANVLGYEIIYDALAKNSYLSCLRYWEGSLLCNRELALSHPYTNLKRGEDTPVITALQKKKAIHLSKLIAPLYIYTYHGNNTWDYKHFSGFFPYCQLLPSEINNLIQDILNADNADDNTKVGILDDLFKTRFKVENKKFNTNGYTSAVQGQRSA